MARQLAPRRLNGARPFACARAFPSAMTTTKSHHCLTLALCGLLLVAAPAVRAQYAVPPPNPPFPGYLDEALRGADPAFKSWDFGINVRLREDSKDEAGTTNAGSNWDFSKRPVDHNSNTYGLIRVMPHAGYADKLFAFYVEGITAATPGDDRYTPAAAGQNLPERDEPIDLYQAYVTVGNPKEFPLTLKVGRQELAYGDQRLVGPVRWLNVPRTFDAAKLHYESPFLGVDVFTGGVVYVDNKNFNRSNSQDRFSGLYATLPQLSKKEFVETYLLARNVARGIVTDNWSGVAAPARFPAPQDLYTAGLRLKSKPGAYGPWDYGLEAMYQFGSRTAVFPASTVAAALAAPRLNQEAYAFIGQAGYTWKTVPWTPRLGVIASVGSGDSNPADGKSGTFQNLFPSNHLLYGAMDLTGLQNARDLRLDFTVKPLSTLTLGLEANFQQLDTASDYWYNAAGAPRNFTGAAVGSGGGYRINPNYGSTLGQEIDFLAGWTILRSTQLEFGAAHYFRGTYIKQSLAAVGSIDANYVYFQLTLSL